MIAVDMGDVGRHKMDRLVLCYYCFVSSSALVVSSSNTKLDKHSFISARSHFLDSMLSEHIKLHTLCVRLC